MACPLASEELMVEFEDVMWPSVSAEGRKRVIKEERKRLELK